MPRSLFSIACIGGGMVFASAMNFMGSHFVVQEPRAVQSTDDVSQRSAVLAQGLGGQAGYGYPGNSQHNGDIIPNAWSKSGPDIPSWLQEVNDDSLTREAALREALGKRIQVKFKDAPLSAVLEYLGKELNVQVVIDAKGLEEETLTPEEPVSVDRTDVRGKDVLRQILEPLNLTTKIDGEAIFVTNWKYFANINRYYDLSSILPDNTLIDELLNAIETSVFPEIWLNAGGTATMTMVGSTLIVSAPEQAQDELAVLLRAVAKQDNANKKPLKRAKVPFISPSSAGKSSQGSQSNESGK